MAELTKVYLDRQLATLHHRLHLSDMKSESINWRLESMDEHFDSYSRSLGIILDDIFIIKTSLGTIKNQITEILRTVKIEERKDAAKFKL